MQHQDKKVKDKIKKIFVVIMLLAFGNSHLSSFMLSLALMEMQWIFLSVEHNLGIASGLYLSKSCWNVQSAEEAYFRQSFTDFFAVFKFNIYLGLFAQIINVFWWEKFSPHSRRKFNFCSASLLHIEISTFAWNFIDVYLMIISLLLTEKFSCVNRKLHNNHRIKSPQFWNEIWCSYKVSVDLVERTNELNGGTILISFFSNLYFICVQLLGCFKSESSLLDGLYLWFSLIFLIGRTMGEKNCSYSSITQKAIFHFRSTAVCWFASQINDESRKPLQVLRSVHSDYFDVTMKRFTEQLVSGNVALSGMNFFYLTRKLILSVSYVPR